MPEHYAGSRAAPRPESDGLPLFDPVPEPPPPPTGPQTDVRKFARAAAYEAWRLTEDGQAVWAFVVIEALLAQAEGAARISVRDIATAARSTLGLEINNNFTARMADELIATYPGLTDLVERREQRKAGP